MKFTKFDHFFLHATLFIKKRRILLKKFVKTIIRQ